MVVLLMEDAKREVDDAQAELRVAHDQLRRAALYDPLTDSWKPMRTTGAPSPRKNHAAVWTGREMVVWGGRDGDRFFNDGARYDPATDAWKPVPLPALLLPRKSMTTVWTGKEMMASH